MSEFDNHLQTDTLSPFYGLISAESLLRSDAIAQLRDRVLTTAPDFNRDEFSAQSCDITKVIEAARTLPMMAPRRYVHVSEIQKLKKKQLEELVAYLDKPSETTTLVLSGEKIDARTKLAVRLKKLGALFVFEPPKPRQLAGWVARRAQQKGIDINSTACALLADSAGASLGTLDMALEQLEIYAEGPVEATHVEELMAPAKQANIFALTDAIGARDLPEASRLLRGVLRTGQHALVVLAMVARALRQILLVKTLHAQGASRQQITKDVGIRPFLLDSLFRQARQFEERELVHALRSVSDADEKLKSTRVPPDAVLDALLIAIVT